MRDAWRKDAVQIKEANLLSPGRKTHIRPHHSPTATTVRNFQTQRPRLFLLTLADGDIDRGIGRMHPAIGNQPKRTGGRRVITKIDFDVMVAGHTLIRAATESIQIVSVECIYDAGDVLSFIVDRASDLAWRGDSCDFQFSRGNNETFVNEDFGCIWVVDDHQAEMIVVVSFPEF